MAADDDALAAPRFPWLRAAALTITVWASLTVAGLAGGGLAESRYLTNTAPAAPYSAGQIATMDSVAPVAARVARRDARLWAESVQIGAGLARAEGTLLGSTAMSALWALAALGWVVHQLRERQRAAKR